MRGYALNIERFLSALRLVEIFPFLGRGGSVI